MRFKVESALKKLTIVIPTYNRPKFALRNMKYWSGKNVCVRVLDGSDQEIDEKLLISLDQNIIYKHDPRSVTMRLVGVLSELDTDYVVLMGDDEFYLPSVVLSCIDELDKDKSLVSCCGCSMAFFQSEGKIFAKEQYAKLIGYDEVLRDSALERIKHHMGNYVPSLIYGVTRKDVWIRAFRAIGEKEFECYAVQELQFEMCVSFAGKAKVLKELMWLRSKEAVPISKVNPVLESKESFWVWWGRVGDTATGKEFVEIMSRAVRDLNYIPSFNYSNAIIEGCEAYVDAVNKYILPESLQEKLYSKMALVLPVFLKSFIKYILKRISFVKNAQSLGFMDQAIMLNDSGVKVNFEEMKEVEEIVLSFYNQTIKNNE